MFVGEECFQSAYYHCELREDVGLDVKEERSVSVGLGWDVSPPRIRHNGSEPSSVLLYGLTYGGKMVAVAYPLYWSVGDTSMP